MVRSVRQIGGRSQETWSSVEEGIRAQVIATHHMEKPGETEQMVVSVGWQEVSLWRFLLKQSTVGVFQWNLDVSASVLLGVSTSLALVFQVTVKTPLLLSGRFGSFVGLGWCCNRAFGHPLLGIGVQPWHSPLACLLVFALWVAGKMDFALMCLLPWPESLVSLLSLVYLPLLASHDTNVAFCVGAFCLGSTLV